MTTHTRLRYGLYAFLALLAVSAGLLAYGHITSAEWVTVITRSLPPLFPPNAP